MSTLELPEHWEKGPCGGTADCYFNTSDPSSFLKLFHKRIPQKTVEAEFNTSRIAEKIDGLLTPHAKELVSLNGTYGILFERIADGKTLADFCGESPEKAEEYAKIFAQQAKQFAKLPCDSEEIPDLVSEMRNAIDAVFLGKAGKKLLHKRLDELENANEPTVLIHGDMHPGNIMFHNGKWYWIDLGYLSKGPELLNYLPMDLLMNFSLTFLFTANRFGMNHKKIHRFYYDFMENCTDIHDPAALRQYCRKIRYFTAVYVIYLIQVENWTGIAKYFMKSICFIFVWLTNHSGGKK